MEKTNSYKKKFTELAISSGYSEEYIEKCLKYSEPLLNKNLPVIYSINHLSALVGYSQSYLTRSMISTSFFYRHFKIKKRNGNLRSISEPLPSLKEIQNFILKEILYTQKVSKYCKSYIPKKNIIEYLKYHVNEKEILTLDLQDFFPSIKFELIKNFFLQLGYSDEVSYYLSTLTTYCDKQEKFDDSQRYLPQGASTSPYLSNLILKDFDNNIGKFCKNRIKYTRYADDLAFSGDNIPSEDIIDFVNKELEKLSLKLNPKKINFMKQNTPQIISGVVVNNKMQLPKQQRNEIRQKMYFINRFGIESHLERIQEKRENYIPHLLGRIQYALNLNPDDLELKKYKKDLQEIYNKVK
ncbi:reverse transcriptase family protein [Chryseobacterium sp. HMWF035]|uniref:reverse transcriptase family protein n=2 Tax=unclassified Chryseobacterium TaxID=2593645 RepID=UPI000D565C00|nr:reverse transcriptase family protein [Chryseobacterium sp. HMWF035]PVV55984.1 reverse transcriptase [Chryseobacterium sp. HMWF035]